jgi:hypothetical protein
LVTLLVLVTCIQFPGDGSRIAYAAGSSANPSNSKSEAGRLRRTGGIPSGAIRPLPTEEFPIDTCVYYGPEEYGASNPVVAAGCSTYLAVWNDARGGTGHHLYCARVTRDGILLDTAGIKLVADEAGLCAVAFDGVNFLVVWQYSAANVADLYGTRVSEAGIVLDPGGFPISTAARFQGCPSVAFDGTNYLVVWIDERNNWVQDVYGARVNTGGGVLDPYGIPISVETSDRFEPAVCSGPNGWLVVWRDPQTGHSIYGARVSASGTVLDSLGFPICQSPGYRAFPQAAFNGSDYQVVWQDERAGTWQTFGARVTTSGNVLDSAGIQLSLTTSVTQNPCLVADSVNCLVAWEESLAAGRREIYGAQVDRNGRVIDSTRRSLTPSNPCHFTPDLCYDGNGYFVVWQNWGDSRATYGSRITRSGLPIDSNGIFISRVPNRQPVGKCVFHENTYLVIFEDRRDGAADIYGMRLSPQGNYIDSLSFAIAFGLNVQMRPTVAAGDSNCLVVWQEQQPDGAIRAARVTYDGALIDSSSIFISTGSNPDVAFDGTNYLVVWCGGNDIYGARVTQSGQVLDPGGGHRLAMTDEIDYTPAVAWGDSCYLLVWISCWRIYPQSYAGLRGVRVSRDCTRLDSTWFAITSGMPASSVPDVAWGVGRFLVTWSYADNLCGCYIPNHGPPGGIFTICNVPGTQSEPGAACNGSDFLVAWKDLRSGVDFDIYCARVSPAGGVSDESRVSAAAGDQYQPSVACGSPGQALFVYTSWTDSINGHIVEMPRVWGRCYPFTGMAEENRIGLSAALELKAAPSVFRASTQLSYHVAQTGPIVLFICDASGREVKRWRSSQQSPGRHEIAWDGTDKLGRRLPGGIYFVRLQVGAGQTQTRCLTLVR